jgi:hypothetical protein
MKRAKVLMIGAAIVAAGAVPAIAQAGSPASDDDATEVAIAGTDLDRASAAAIDHLGGGKVTGTEVRDEESYYEVEVTLESGEQVDVQLDQSFKVVGTGEDRSED